MKKTSLPFFLASAMLLAGCGINTPASSVVEPDSETTSEIASQVAPESSAEQPASTSEAAPEVKTVATLQGSIVMDYTAFGMGKYTVDVTLALKEDKTGAYTLAYSGVDPFTYEGVTWDADATGAIVANIITVSAEGESSAYAASIFVSGETYFGYVPTNLGSCLISNAELSEVASLAGQTVMDYSAFGMGKYTCDASIALLSKGLAIYTLAYTTEQGEKVDVSKIALPTTWETNAETGTTTVNLFNISAEGEISAAPTEVYLSGTETIAFAAAKVSTNLGEFYCTNGQTYLATMTGKTEVDYGDFGKFSCAYTVALFNNWALITADYGANGNFTAPYPMTANEDGTLKVAGFVWGQEEGQTQDIIITNADGVYTATMTSGLGEIAVTSAPAA